MRKYYEIELEFEDLILGGKPYEDMFHNWASVAYMKPNEKKEIFVGSNPNVKERFEDLEREKLNSFMRDAKGDIYIEEKAIKSLIRDVILNSDFDKDLDELVKKIKSVVRSVNHSIFADRKIYLRRSGKKIKKIDDIVSKICRNRGIGIFEAIREPRIKFTLAVHKPSIYSTKLIKEVFSLGEEVGLGASRAMSYGKFKIIKITEKNKK